MATRDDTGRIRRKPVKKPAAPLPEIVALGCSGKNWVTVKNLLTPFVHSLEVAILLTDPVSKPVEAKLPDWLKLSRHRVRKAANGIIPVARTIYITAAGYRSWINDNTIVLEPLRKKTENNYAGQLQSALHDLNERVKEQTCLYSISRLIASNPAIEHLLQQTCRLIPPGWQYPEHTLAVITYGKKEFRSSRLRKSSWSQAVNSVTTEGVALRIEVFYVKKMPASDEGPFLKNERALLNTISEILNVYIGQTVEKGHSQLNEEMLKEAQRLTMLGSWNFDVVKNKVYWSDAVYEIFGVDKSVFSKSFGAFFGLVVQEDRKRVMTAMKAARLKGDSFHMEYCIITPEGVKKYLEEYGHSEMDKQGRVLRLFGTVQDISRRKHTEKALSDADKNYRNLFETSPLPSYIFCLADFRILDMNERALRRYGYSRKEMLQMTIKQLRPSGEVPKLLTALKKEERRNEPVSFGVFTHCHKSGRLMQMDITGQRVMYMGKESMLVLAADITDKVLKYEIEKLERVIIELSLGGKTEIQQLLGYYIGELEKLFPDSKASLLRVQQGRLYNLFSSSLPADYVAAIEGLGIGPSVGSCGTSVFQKKLVIVADIAHDPLWANFKEMALASGLKACWSYPVFNSEGEVTATFANYFSTPRKPTTSELEFFIRAGSLVSLILESYEKEQRLQISYERFGYVTKATSDAIWDWNLVDDKTFCGDGFSEILGETLTEDQWNLNVWLGYIHNEDRSLIMDTVTKVMAGNDNRWEHEYRVRKADGRYGYVSDRAYIIRDKKGKPLRIIGAIRDVTAKREEEQRLRLFENIVINSSDAVVITRSGPIDDNGPEVVYVNEAFTRMSGYSPEEITGKTPRILQGPKSDRAELSRLKLALKRGEPCELSTINYRKSGEEYRVFLSVQPVKDVSGRLTHYFAIQRDITQQDQQQKQRRLMEIVNTAFKQHESLVLALAVVLKKLVEFGDFTAAETWLLSAGKKKFNLVANFAATKEAKDYFTENKALNSLTPEGGLLKEIWEKKQLVILADFVNHPTLRRREGVRKAGFKSALGIPLLYKGELIGAVSILTDKTAAYLQEFEQLFSGLESELGAEVKRKQLENELSITFSSVPDIIAVVGYDGFFKRLNPAAAAILGYSSDELMSRPYQDFIHPDFVQSTNEVTGKLPQLTGTGYFENCYISKSGKPVWLAWTYQQLPQESLVFCVAKDITRQKELQRLLHDATTLARIGAWEMDIASGQINWSAVTREIHEVPADYVPVLDKVFSFYRDEDRNRLSGHVKRAIEQGESYDVELLHVTGRGNEHWVRVIGTPEFSNGKCVRLYGSFQDIHQRKIAELELEQRMKYLTAISSITHRFLEQEDWHKATEQAFEVAGSVIQADRIYYFENNVSETTGEFSISLRLEWTNGKVEPQINDPLYQDMAVGQYTELLAPLMADQPFTALASQLKETDFGRLMQVQKIRSILLVPIMVDNMITGLLGVDDCATERIWSNGEILFIRSIASSLSASVQRSKGQQALNQLLTERSEILESIGDGFFAVDKNWTVTYWNRKAEDITRIKRTEIIGNLIWDKFPPDHESPGNKALQSAMESGQNTSFEMYFSPLGIWVEGSVYPTVHGLATYFKDISIRKKAEEQIRESNDRFEKVMEATNEAIWDMNMADDTIYWGRGFRKIFGHHTGEEFDLTAGMYAYLHPEEADAIREEMKKAVEDSGIDNWQGEFRFRKKDGKYANTINRCVILRDESGKAVRMVGSLTDITYRKEYEQSLQLLNENLEKQTKELQVSNTELEQFAYVASHDLQEPLRMITSFLTKLDNRYGSQLDDRARQYIGFAVDGAVRMRQNILDLLQYSRVGKGDSVPENIDINEVVEEVRRLHLTDLTDCGAVIETGPLPVIHNYMAPVVQVFNNIISNAIKYRKPGIAPRIHVSAVLHGDTWEFAIRDNGIGIPAEYLQKIFVIFQRLHTKENYSGTGIGLAVVKKIITNLGGRVWVESEPDNGSTFRITIQSLNVEPVEGSLKSIYLFNASTTGSL